MKLNSNTKRILLFAALLLAAYLISLAFGGKDDPASQSQSSISELETGVLEPETEDRSSAGITETETERTAQEDEPEAESLSEPEEDTEELEALTLEEETEELEALTLEEETEEPDTLEEETSKEPEPESTEVVTTEEKTTEEKTTEAQTKETSKAEPQTTEAETTEKSGISVEEDGEYTDKDHVALYIYTYGHLPDNFITKKEANELGWPEEGNLGQVAPGKSIGGDYFGNYEGLLPKKKGRKYYECDIDFKGKSRGAKRIIFSNDGLIFYTDDHYESFEQLYGGD